MSTAPKNVSNIEDLDSALARLVTTKFPTAGPELKKWVTVVGKREALTSVACFRKLTMRDVQREYKTKPWMLKAYPAGTDIWEFDEEDFDWQRFTEDLEHAVVYLASMIATGQKNIMPVPFDKAVLEGVKAFERQKLDEKLLENEDDKKLVHKYSNGFAWWDLMTPKSMRNESCHMGHCVGNENMGYARRVSAGEIRVISLRDKLNIPHVTIEFEKLVHYIRQVKGNGNKGVNEKYKSAVIGLLKGMIDKQEVKRLNVNDLTASSISANDLGTTLDADGHIV